MVTYDGEQYHSEAFAFATDELRKWVSEQPDKELRQNVLSVSVQMVRNITKGAGNAIVPQVAAENHVAGQLIRSGTSPAPNYGEARSAESRKDFIHKMKISLKELRETMIWLKIISRKDMVSGETVNAAIVECDELIAIFVSSTRTADGR